MSLFTVTESAKSQMVKICNKQDADVVRFSIKGGGCAGFEYNWEISNSDSIENLDEVIELAENKKFVVDNISIMYIAGAEFDFVEELMGSAFKVNNPNASSSCGCGESVGFSL
jgi:iron-sulfur cluster assembly accessory protein